MPAKWMARNEAGMIVRLPDDGTEYDWTYYVRPDGEQRVRKRDRNGKRIRDKPAAMHSAFRDRGWRGVSRNSRTGIYRGTNPETGQRENAPPELQKWGEDRDRERARLTELVERGDHEAAVYRIRQTLYRQVNG